MLMAFKKKWANSFSTFITSHYQPLVDLYLYVSTENFFTTTSPSYAKMLQWPNQWILPPRIRSLAKQRTEDLGLASSSLDAIDGEEQASTVGNNTITTTDNTFFLRQKPRDTVSSLLGKTMSQQNRFKLDALTGEAFGLLETLLNSSNNNGNEKNGGYLLHTNRPTTLDCLAVGYLSLTFYPDVPHPWLREALQSKAPGMTQYTKRMHRQCFGEQQHQQLPWQPPPYQSVGRTIGTTLLTTLADSTPILKDIRANSRLLQQGGRGDLSGQESKAVSEYARSRMTDLYVSTASAALGISALVGYMFYVNILPFGSGVD